MVLSIKYVVLRRPKHMIRYICSIAAYILKFGSSTFIFLGVNGIFYISSLKIARKVRKRYLRKPKSVVACRV